MQAPKTSLKKENKNKLIGLEFENQLVYLDSGFTIKRGDIRKLWNNLANKPEWEPVYDKYTKALIGVNRKSRAGEIVVNTDTGVGLLEIAMPPEESLVEAEKNWKKVFKEIVDVAKYFNFTPIDLGASPRPFEKNLYSVKTQKGLYDLIKERIARHNLMIPVSSHQACVDVDFDKTIDAVNCLTKIGGFLISLTANSVLENDQIQKWKEIRTLHWAAPLCNKIKNQKAIFQGFPDKPFENFSDYLKSIWQATPLVIIKNGEWSKIDDWEVTAWDYLNNKNGYNGKTADEKDVFLKAKKKDLNLMMMLSWKDVKPHILIDENKINLKDFLLAINKGNLDEYLEDKLLASYIEVRTLPVGPKGEEMAIPALILGLVENLNETIYFSEKFSWKEGRELKNILSIKGMDYEFKGSPIVDYLHELLKIAEKGLLKRGLGEEKYLEVLFKRVEEGKTPADRTIEIFREKGINGVLEKSLY